MVFRSDVVINLGCDCYFLFWMFYGVFFDGDWFC